MTPPLRKPDTSTYRGRFAARLRELRMEKFESQPEFLKSLVKNGLDVKVMAVSQWETGRTAPHIDMLPIIARVLGVTVSELMPPK